MHSERTQATIFVIAGMHRSGTSLTAALLQSAGVDVGQRLMGADTGNVKGHFENLDFVELHEDILDSQGFHRAGWILEKSIPVQEQYLERSKSIVIKNSGEKLWGWKDPRTTLFLNFWANLIPEAKFLLTYRTPWDVIDSLYRRGDKIFHANPNLAIELWIFYNKLIIEFYQKFPDRCLLFNIDNTIEDSSWLVKAIKDKFGILLSPPDPNIYDSSLFSTQVSTSHRLAIVDHYFHEAVEIYHKLNALSAPDIQRDKTSNLSSWELPDLSYYKNNFLKDWLDIRRLERQQSELGNRLQQAQSQLQSTQSQLQQTQSQLQQTQSQLQSTQSELEQSNATIAAMETSKFWKIRAAWFKVKEPTLRSFAQLGTKVGLKLQTVSSSDRTYQPATANSSIREVSPPPPLAKHSASVDIIVCVHNAPDDVKRCLESVIRYSRMPYTLIVVDDGSSEETCHYLTHFAQAQGAIRIRNEQAKGYTFAANQGLRQSQADYAILLNSDTIVTPSWLDRIVACGESDPNIGLIGPLSNTASWQSIPELRHQGDWAENQLPEGMTVADMGRLVAQYSERLYPRLPFLNGFCLTIKRKMLEALGYFDEATFGEGYGEENDYCLRAYKAGWQLAVADDTYIYHSQSRSYSHDRRKALVGRADKALVAKHSQQMISDNVNVCRFNRVIAGVRARCRVMQLRSSYIEAGKSRWEGKRVLVILPVIEPGGGSNVILQEAAAMQKMGVDVRIVNLSSHRAIFDRSYPNREIPVIYVDKEHQISDLMKKYDAIVATLYRSVDWMEPLVPNQDLPIRGYYIQDFEPYFFPKHSEHFKTAWHSYTRYPDLVRITKTEWNREVVKTQIGVDCAVVEPSFNLDLYRPRRRVGSDWPGRPLRIAAMIRPNTPRRQPEFTMKVLRELYRTHGNIIEVVLFGCRSDDPDFLALPHDFPWHNAGILTQPQLAFLLNETDIFVDFSSFQAMGLTAMEAMGCGNAVIVPQQGGAETFARHEKNSLVADTSSPEVCFKALNRLVLEESLRTQLQRQAIADICQYFPEKAAYNTLNVLFPV